MLAAATPPAVGAAVFEHAPRCADRADAAIEATLPGGYSLWLPGIGEDFAFDELPGRFVERADGTALLSGVVRSRSDRRQAFQVEIELRGRVQSPPPGSPKKELRAEAYVENGGSVNPESWFYFNELDGRLYGLEALAGAELQIDGFGPALQVGIGANGRNLGFGASSWLFWRVLSQPLGAELQPLGQGDLSLDLDFCSTHCVQQALPDPDYVPVSVYAHALRLQGIDEELRFAEESFFVEYASGEARLRGRLSSKKNPGRGWELDLHFSARSQEAPPGSPQLELPAMAYSAAGGPVQPATWHYYEQMAGRLIGTGSWAGAEVEILRSGPSVQVGEGASGKNTLLGVSGWMTYRTVRQPDLGQLPKRGDGELDLSRCPAANEVQARNPRTCHATSVLAYTPGTTGAGTLSPEQQLQDTRKALGRPQGGDVLDFVSLGFGGSLTLAFDRPVFDGPGTDLQVVETTYAGKHCEEVPERARVKVSQDGERWFDLGTTCQDGSFDLAGLAWVRYLRIEDESRQHDFFSGIAADGFDVDGIVARHCSR